MIFKKTTVFLFVITLLVLFSLTTTTARAESQCAWGVFEVIDLNDFGISTNICDVATTGNDNLGGLANIIEVIILTLTALVIMTALISLVVGGYIYMTAGGSADRVKLAKTWIISAILGIVIALSSWIILGTISHTLI